VQRKIAGKKIEASLKDGNMLSDWLFSASVERIVHFNCTLSTELEGRFGDSLKTLENALD
jgi:hypothetical protein